MICDLGMKTSIAKNERLPITRLCTYLAVLSPHEKEFFAKSCDTSVGYLVQVSRGFRKDSAALTNIITANSHYQVTPHDLRADLYPNPSDAIPADFHSIATSDVAKNVCGA